ncbi:DNA (cytosine-5)-methyltransferase 1 [Vogesella indigofera]|uniref:DNA (cytosine-5-)-methyltransferase n=1 Tax=Vogesella indigofera TaxID=45465 RepID=A0A495BBG1_VOGIN|nr:DNA cytosine methyltransferase [Vogesella indigofera]RKQ57833.1 DNA (cytosine-5)-methyltransferase 1 [Vogesella indigofera]
MSTNTPPIPVVDLFAGPGGLGEGFSSLQNGRGFQIAVSAEKDPIAHQTLRLRAFYRLLHSRRPEKLTDYYRFCNGESEKPFSCDTIDLWNQAGEEALCIEIGSTKGNAALDAAIQHALGKTPAHQPWVLIGGPPCQAYSLVGRARNMGKVDYKPEEDNRHFLYREYLRIIQNYQPHIFVMENVKGILSSRINGEQIFHQILRDLANPDAALKTGRQGQCYRIVSLVHDITFRDGDDPAQLDAAKYIIRAEEHGIPQARHRVILLGIREDHYHKDLQKLDSTLPVGVKEVIDNLPPLRSQLSKQKDSAELWVSYVRQQLGQLAVAAARQSEQATALVTSLRKTVDQVGNFIDTGGTRLPKKAETGNTGHAHLDTWLLDPRLKVWLNHETRGHRIDDLARYGYAANFALVNKRSPKGHQEFDLPGLAPAHKNWETGKFSDRFRVQTADGPSTTITSHISKDGHYFIHYDPAQCRSLTVREAARLQTFPDNYFFQGGRTQQYHQVGNAVPPLLAHQIAKIVADILA